MKAYLETHGCALNYGEAREIEDILVGNGWDMTYDQNECDLAVLVTCVVIEKTERKMLKRVQALAQSPNLVVAGCMAAVGSDKVARIAPDARFVLPGEVRSLAEAVNGLNLEKSSGRDREGYAIVPIATGCLGSCSYCITRAARGVLRSRSIDSIASRVEQLARSGPREIQLTAQDTACFGIDTGHDLAELVGRVCAIPLDFRLRIGMMNPRSAIRLGKGLQGVYSQKKVFKFLHLPVQSGSDRILREMQRGYTIEECRSVITCVRESAPDMMLSTDLIVGYPGEGCDDHAANLSFISEFKPEIVNVTKFSPRPGTPAAEDKPVPGRIVKERSRELTRLRFRVSLECNRAWIGRRLRALATEHGKEGTTKYRTNEYRQIVVDGAQKLGEYAMVDVIDATRTYLIGQRAGPA